MNKTLNIYHKLSLLDGLELLDARRHTLNFPAHSHNTFNITLVNEQIFSTKLADRLLQAGAGKIVITNPGEVHATFCDNHIGTSFFTFYVSPGVLIDLNNRQPVYFENKIVDDKALFDRFYDLSQNFDQPTNELEKELLLILKQLITKQVVTNACPDKKITLFQRFLEEENMEKFSLENTARQFGLDKYKFLRLFKLQTGLTPNNYIILKRIEKSKALLQTQDDLLSVAVQAGFYDATHLCRHFKKITGVTPMAYRDATLCNIVP